jgi:hypothetical protein
MLAFFASAESISVKMARQRLKGPLDPLFEALDIATVEAFAALLEVSRQTVTRWQNDGAISPYNQMRIDLLFIGRGLKPPFKKRSGGISATTETGKRKIA